MKFLLGLILGFTFDPSITQAETTQNDENILHIYSSRHYNTDEALYENFTKQTGIKIQRIDGKGDALIARLQQEGDKSPADLLITVDSGRLWRAEEAGLFEPIKSKKLNKAIPANLRHDNGQWYGFSKRARILVYNNDKIEKGALTSYQDLADPKYKGRVCIRSSSNIYNLSLMASMIAMNGEEKAKNWAQGVLNNLARKPQGGDTDQIKAVAANLCDIALVNSYYFYRLQRSNKQEDQNVVANLMTVFPNQKTDGTHINISGAGVLKHSDNKEAAVQFLEYLVTSEAQKYFADGNNEFPVVKKTEVNDLVKKDLGFKEQKINVQEFGKNQQKAKMIFDEIKFP